MRMCLFSVWDHDLHELMRRGASDEKLAEFVVKVVERKEERHHNWRARVCARFADDGAYWRVEISRCLLDFVERNAVSDTP